MSPGIYISVPFCRSKCTYCNFASGVFSAGQMGRYVERISEDIRSVCSCAGGHGGEIPNGTVDSIYLGGGTPSLLPSEHLKRLFCSLRDEFAVAPGAEITVECAPGTLSDSVIET